MRRFGVEIDVDKSLCSRHLSGISDFLLLAIHRQGQCVLPVSCLTGQRVAEPAKIGLVTVEEALNRIRGRGVLRFAALLSRR